jgi:hypothetical protein
VFLIPVLVLVVEVERIGTIKAPGHGLCGPEEATDEES